jgi:hypothetical protein
VAQLPREAWASMGPINISRPRTLSAKSLSGGAPVPGHPAVPGVNWRDSGFPATARRAFSTALCSDALYSIGFKPLVEVSEVFFGSPQVLRILGDSARRERQTY